MSTRCMIEFRNIWKKDKGKDIIERRTVYRHSDGYPKGVVPDLKEFLKWNKGRNDDVEYQTANFIYWSKRRFEEEYFNKNYSTGKIENPKLKWSDCQNTNCSQLHLGFGVCENDNLHGDIEYYYEVEHKESITIRVYEVKRKSWDQRITKKDLKLIKTIKVK